MAEPRQGLCVVSPCYNEHEAISRFYEAMNAIGDHDPCVRVYSLSRNFGAQVATTAGLDMADGDAVIMMDCDLQHPPGLIRQLVEKWRSGNDVVSAVRGQMSNTTWFKKFSSKAFYWLLNTMSETPMVAGAGEFCLLSRRAHQAIRAMPERHRFLRGMVAWIGFPRAFVPFQTPPRAGGQTDWSARRLVGLAADAIFSFSVTPIRLATRLGLVVIATGACYLAYVLIENLFPRSRPRAGRL